MARTSTPPASARWATPPAPARWAANTENHRPRSRRLLIYGVGFVLLTNALTVLFVFLLRNPKLVSIAVVSATSTPVAQAAAAPTEAAAVATRQVQVTSRPSGAVVRYQGDVRGTTPVVIALPADEASVLSLEKSGYRARSVTVEPGETQVRVRLYHAPVAGSATQHTGTARPAAARPPDRAADPPGKPPAPVATVPAPAPAAAPAASAPAAKPEAIPAASAPAAAASQIKPSAERPARPTPGRRPASPGTPQPSDGAERPAPNTPKNLDPWAE
jgi:hypothetical protein